MWDQEKIFKKEQEKLMEKVEGKTREEIIAMLLDLRCAVYPIAYTLSSICDSPAKDQIITSGLMPDDLDDVDDNLDFWVWDKEQKTYVKTHIDNKDLHKYEFVKRESVLFKGEDIDDSVTIIDCHQYHIGAYGFGGGITFKDARLLEQTFFNVERKPTDVSST